MLDPVSTKGLGATDVNKLCDDTRNNMLAALEAMAKDPDSQSKAKAQ